MKKKLYLIALLAGLYSHSYAVQKIFLFFVNGIQNTQDEARINAAALDSLISVNSNIVNNNGRVITLYNKKGGVLEQTKDVFLQKDNERISLDQYIQTHLAVLGISNDRGERSAMRNMLLEKYFSNKQMGNNFSDLSQQLAQQLGEPDPRLLTKFISLNSANESQKPFVLLIPHSQGNLYANNLYQLLKEAYGYGETNLAIYGIATPAARNLGNYISRTYYYISGTNQRDPGYVTSINDKVINGLRGSYTFGLPGFGNIIYPVLPGNVDLPSDRWYSENHSLIDTYLTDGVSRKRIKNGVENILHYFWLSNIYINPTAPSNNHQLAPGVSLVATQDPTSTLMIPGILAKGKCSPNVTYFTTYDVLYDEVMGVGAQCIVSNKGIYNLEANDYQDSNRIKLLFNGKLKQQALTNTDDTSTEAYCATEVLWQPIAGNYFSGIIGGAFYDQSCEKRQIHDPILKGSAKSDKFKGVVGTLELF